MRKGSLRELCVLVLIWYIFISFEGNQRPPEGGVSQWPQSSWPMRLAGPGYDIDHTKSGRKTMEQITKIKNK